MKRSTDRTIVAGDAAALRALPSRREFLRLVATGGSLVLAGGLLAACDDAVNDGGLTGPGTGATLTIDFSKGDIALLQFVAILEQLEADFYSRVVANFPRSDFTTSDQLVLTDIAKHEAVHREVLSAILGTNGVFKISPTYGSLTFRVRADVLAFARVLEDVSTSAYPGIAPYFTDSANLALLGKILSVEGRHAAAIRDLISPLTGTFAPSAFESAAMPSVVAAAVQPFIEDKLAFASAPATFALGASAPLAITQAPPDVIGALQAVLLLAQIQSDLYQRGASVSGLIPSADTTVYATLATHETAHVNALQTLITARGSASRTRPTLDFTAKGNLPGFAFLPTQYAQFSMLAQALEDIGVRVWQGQLKILLEDSAALQSGLSMLAVQARHSSEIRRLRGKKGWITGNNRDDLPAFMQVVYDGEENTTQGGVNAATLGGIPAANEAFDEALTPAQATAFLALFLP